MMKKNSASSRLDKVQTLSATDIVKLRKDYGFSQNVFSQFLRVTSRTVAYWERDTSGIKPGEYQKAMLLLLRLALDEARAEGSEQQYRKQLESVLPDVLFRGGVFRLHIFLIRHFNALKHEVHHD